MSVHQFVADPRSDLIGTAPESDPYAERILTAARAQLLEFGLARTSLDRIAAAAGVSRATLFKRFHSRDALLGAIATRELRRFIARIDREMASIDDPEERIVYGFVAVLHSLSQRGLVARLLETDRETMLAYLTTEAEPLFAMWRSYLAAGFMHAREQGCPISGDPEVIAELLIRIGHSLLLAPSTVLPIADERRLTELARAHVLPLVRG